jgi:hypothetical protein
MRAETVCRSLERDGRLWKRRGLVDGDSVGDETFKSLLAHHFRQGTRPSGHQKKGVRWGTKEFADLVGVNDRTVRNWLQGKGQPNDTADIERLLFGSVMDDRFSERIQLRTALERSKRSGETIGKSSGQPMSSPATADVAQNGEITLNQLASTYALIGAAKGELDANGRMTNSVADALIQGDIDPAALDEFLRLYAEKSSDLTLYCVATMAADLAMTRGVGFNTVEYCLSCGRLGDNWLEWAIGRLMWKRPTAKYALPAHRLISEDSYKPFADAHYYSFLMQFGSTIAQHDETLILAYLLSPVRGPGNLLIDAFEIAIDLVKQPSSLIARWNEWISDGYFDNRQSPRCEFPEVLYKKLSRGHAQRPDLYMPIAENTHRHVVHLFQKRAFEDCLFHLNSMVFAEYALADTVAREVLLRIETPAAGSSMSLRLGLAKEAIYSLAKLQSNPTQQQISEFRYYKSAIINAQPDNN